MAVLNFFTAGFAVWLEAEWDENPIPVEVKEQHNIIRQRSRQRLSGSCLRGPLSRRVRPRTTAGNGKTMAETTKKTIHKRAKGRITNGKPGRRTTGREGTEAKHPVGWEKTAQAEAQKREKTAVERKRPHTSDATRRSRKRKDGLTLLREQAELVIERDYIELIEGLKKKALEGNVTDLRHLEDLATAAQEARPDNREGPSVTNSIQRIQSESEWKEPPEMKEVKEELNETLEAQPAGAAA